MSDKNVEVEMRGAVPYLNGAAMSISGALASGKIVVGSAGGAAAAVDMSGDATISNTGVLSIGADKVAATELGVTAGTVLASKAVVVDANKDATGFRNVGLSGSLVFGAGATMDVDSAAVAATGNDTTQTATVTKMAGTITTGALTTAANATTAVVLTLTGVVAGDIVLVTLAGGSNTTSVTINSAIATTNTITIVLRNDVLTTTALNGTVAFHYLWLKA